MEINYTFVNFDPQKRNIFCKTLKTTRLYIEMSSWLGRYGPAHARPGSEIMWAWTGLNSLFGLQLGHFINPGPAWGPGPSEAWPGTGLGPFQARPNTSLKNQ